MAFVRVKRVRRGSRSYEYLQLVEGKRSQGKVRQRVVATLGRVDELKQSGQLDRLAAAFARLDPPTHGIRREVGPLLLVHKFIQRLGVLRIIDSVAPPRGRALLSTAEVITAFIANRLCAPSPLYDIAGWGSGAAIHEIFGVPAMLLNDDRLGRALEDFALVAEQVRGAVMLSAIEQFGVDAARLHLDLTALRFEGAYENSSIVAKGWAANDRRVARQVKALAATNSHGVPLYVRPESGNAAELSVVGAAFERLAELLPPGLLLCADSAMGHAKTLCAAARSGLRFVIPLREDSGFRSKFVDEVGHDALSPIRYVSRRQKTLPASKRNKYLGTLRPFPLTDPETGQVHAFRVAYIFSSEEQKSVAEARERALAKAEDALARVKRGLGGVHYKTKEDVDARVGTILTPAIKGLLKVTTGSVKGKPTLSYSRNDKAIEDASRTDGIYALATNLPGAKLTAGKVLRIYKDQSLVECAHKNLKGTLKVRPVFLHNDDRIAGLASVVGVALVIFGLIENELRKALGDEEVLSGLLPEGRGARPTGRNILACFQGLGITYTPGGIVVDRLTGTQRRILELLDVTLPWAENSNALVGSGPRTHR